MLLVLEIYLRIILGTQNVIEMLFYSLNFFFQLCGMKMFLDEIFDCSKLAIGKV
jgi:hypothetical protein